MKFVLHMRLIYRLVLVWELNSSFAVGMLNAFYALKGKYADKKKLADEAIYLERELCQEAGGWQDQIAASFGALIVLILQMKAMMCFR